MLLSVSPEWAKYLDSFLCNTHWYYPTEQSLTTKAERGGGRKSELGLVPSLKSMCPKSYVCVFPGEERVICLSVGHGCGRVCSSDRRRLHADYSRKQHEHQRLRHGPAARQSLQRPLLSEVRFILLYIKLISHWWQLSRKGTKLYSLVLHYTTCESFFNNLAVITKPKIGSQTNQRRCKTF